MLKKPPSGYFKLLFLACFGIGLLTGFDLTLLGHLQSPRRRWRKDHLLQIQQAPVTRGGGQSGVRCVACSRPGFSDHAGLRASSRCAGDICGRWDHRLSPWGRRCIWDDTSGISSFCLS